MNMNMKVIKTRYEKLQVELSSMLVHENDKLFTLLEQVDSRTLREALRDRIEFILELKAQEASIKFNMEEVSKLIEGATHEDN